jgi:subtilisin-like proprotein convertase family protein
VVWWFGPSRQKENSVRKTLARLALTALALSTLVAVAPTEAAVAAGDPCQRTYSSGVINAPIADFSTTNYTVEVPEDGLVPTDIDVQVDLHHSNDSSLSIGLFSFTDAEQFRGSALLFSQRGGTGDNLLGTVFDDSATTPISGSGAPFTGRFIPEQPLAGVAGVAGGRWKLQIGDSVAGEMGVLNDWSVTFTYPSCDFDHDGVEDHVDSCPSLTGMTASGCPVASRSVTARYRHGKFKGWLVSSASACSASRKVTVWKVRSGPDRRIGTVSSRSDGFYKLVRSRHRGRYYATSPALLAPGAAECRAVRSATFRIR